MLKSSQASIHYDQVSKIKTFEHIQTIFQTACPSISISDDILRHYGLTPELSLSALRNRILLFLTDLNSAIRSNVPEKSCLDWGVHLHV
jgi:hypothetical protein